MPNTNTNHKSAADNAPDILGELNRLRSEVESLRGQNDTKQDLINRQQALLINTPAHQGPPASQQEDPNAPPMTKLMNFLKGQFTEMRSYVDDQVGSLAEQSSQLMRNATPDSPVWNKTAIAEQLVKETPGLPMKLALELADKRLVDQQTQQAAETEAARKAEAEIAARQSSIGQRDSTSTSPPSSKGKDLNEIMAQAWDSTGMEEASKQIDMDLNVWDLPSDQTGVEVL